MLRIKMKWNHYLLLIDVGIYIFHIIFLLTEMDMVIVVVMVGI